jgi:hypothetical protein
VHKRALPKLIALEGAVFVTLHDFEIVFRGKGPKISILWSGRSSKGDQNVVSIGTHFETYAAITGKRLLDLRGLVCELEGRSDNCRGIRWAVETLTWCIRLKS